MQLNNQNNSANQKTFRRFQVQLWCSIQCVTLSLHRVIRLVLVILRIRLTISLRIVLRMRIERSSRSISRSP
uniref:Uncharacterized protein n=1 Tax=Picea glauca TaxID=3330 RepID=A0A101LUK1_PICGL|nr:hypothetical protein ABT39_MTgene2460 [Picea glauca]